jgi:hypothetical protein
MEAKLRDLYVLYKQQVYDIDDPQFICFGSGAMCILSFYSKIFVSDREPMASDLSEDGLNFCFQHIQQGMRPLNAEMVLKDCRAFLRFIDTHHRAKVNSEGIKH